MQREQRALRARKKKTPEDFGSEVWWVRDFKIVKKMVKISAKGLTEEVRALFELMVSRFTKTSEEFLAHISQSRSMCKAKLPLHMVNSKEFRGETGLATFTYTKTTQMIAVQAGAAHLDMIEDTMSDVMEKYGATLKANEILPMREGTENGLKHFERSYMRGLTRSSWRRTRVKRNDRSAFVGCHSGSDTPRSSVRCSHCRDVP